MARLRTLVNDRDAVHEAIVVVISYLFIFAGSWNDGYIGLPSSPWSKAAELFMAICVALEIVSRMVFVRRKTLPFWTFVTFDSISLLTIFPTLQWIAFARLLRAFYASWRLIALLDRLAYRRRNPMYLIGLYPLVVPLLAIAVYAMERGTPGSAIHNYLQALSVCLTFALTLGSVRPVSFGGTIVCGFLLLLGIVCLGILANALSTRYEFHTDRLVKPVPPTHAHGRRMHESTSDDDAVIDGP